MTTMPRARTLLWVTTTSGCLMSGGPDEAGRRPERSGELEVVAIEAERVVGRREIMAALWPDLRGRAYQPATAERVQATATLLREAVAHARGETGDERLPELAAAARLRLKRWTIDGQRFLAVLETPAVQGSVGAFLLRVGPPTEEPEQLLQAPHAYYDVGTGDIAVRVLLADPGQLRGLFTNTLHRHIQEDGEKESRDDDPADVCHNDAHAFVAATDAVVAALGSVEVIQLHGYGDGHVLADQPGAWAVISAGEHDDVAPRIVEIEEALERELGVAVVVYPRDVDELGGTTNVIGRRVRAQPEASFVHLEMSSQLRRALRRRGEWPAKLARALRWPSPETQADERGEERSPAP